jgi:hypothetical protein
LVLPRMWQEFYGISSPVARNLSGQASGQLKLPEKRITSDQAPLSGSLTCFANVTTHFLSAEVT